MNLKQIMSVVPQRPKTRRVLNEYAIPRQRLVLFQQPSVNLNKRFVLLKVVDHKITIRKYADTIEPLTRAFFYLKYVTMHDGGEHKL